MLVVISGEKVCVIFVVCKLVREMFIDFVLVFGIGVNGCVYREDVENFKGV